MAFSAGPNSRFLSSDMCGEGEESNVAELWKDWREGPAIFPENETMPLLTTMGTVGLAKKSKLHRCNLRLAGSFIRSNFLRTRFCKSGAAALGT